MNKDPFQKTTEFINWKQTSRELRPANIPPPTQPGDRALNRLGEMALGEVSPSPPDYTGITNDKLTQLQTFSLDVGGRLRINCNAPLNVSGTITGNIGTSTVSLTVTLTINPSVP